MKTEGKIVAVPPGTMFRVALANEHLVLAHISGKIRKRFIRLTTGDLVKLEISPLRSQQGTHRVPASLATWWPGEVSRHSGLLRDFAGCFVDYRDQCYIEHSVQELAVQRIASPRAGFGPGSVVVARRVCRHRYRKKGRSRFLRRGWWSQWCNERLSFSW